jgi:Ca-activated chloride channel homolog
MTATRGRTAAALVLAAAGLAWLDPHQSARQANRLYDAGKFDEAVTKYNEALVDEPDSALLHFNLGDAAYRQGKYDDALRAFGDVPARDDDPARTARTAYNVGNASYRLGQAAEASDPKAALGHYAEALVAYRRALGVAPDDTDAKFNHEFVERKMAELKKRLEEEQKKKDEQKQNQDQQQQDQQKQDEQKQDQQNADQQKQDQQKQDEQKQDDEKQDQGKKDQEKKDQEKKDEQPQDQPQQQAKPEAPKPQEQQQAGGGQAGEKKDGEMSPEEAAALLDAQRGDEVSPADIVKRLQRGGVAEPAEDW